MTNYAITPWPKRKLTAEEAKHRATRSPAPSTVADKPQGPRDGAVWVLRQPTDAERFRRLEAGEPTRLITELPDGVDPRNVQCDESDPRNAWLLELRAEVVAKAEHAAKASKVGVTK